MSLSPETKRILSVLIAYWEDAARSERDLDEIEAFTVPAWRLHQALDGTHEDIRKVLPRCPMYPKWGRHTLAELADAERDGRRIIFKKEPSGALIWEIQ